MHLKVEEPPGAADLVAVVLAAGQGTRMRSNRHKVLHLLGGRPLIERVLDLLQGAGVARVVVVLGHAGDQVRRLLPESVDTAIQEPQLGTGHAVRVAAAQLQPYGAERLLVHYGDAALVRPASLGRLIATGVSQAAPIALLNARVRDPLGYGRVIRLADGSVDGIVEEVETTAEQRAIDEIWSGSLLVFTPWLWSNLEKLPLRAKGEYYLTDLVAIARAQGLSVRATLTEDEEEVYGVNDRQQLAVANAILRRRTLDDLLRSGVTIVDPATTYIEPEVTIEPDAVIQPGCHLRGRTRIARDCEIGPNTFVLDSEIGAGSRIWFSVLEGASVGQRVSIGPFSHLRAGAVIEDDVELGNYAEVKASRVGAGTKMHHFSYVGDASIGKRVNIGAGTITVNFSSETDSKSQTLVEDDASLGSDTLLVAPVRVGAGAMTAAGAVVTHDIPSGEVWIGAPARAHRRRRGYPAVGEEGAGEAPP
ncbi:MAG TPA: bifunctional UDP-N-acetylglucosamine diphosphorylase/glucosamine-1-phosphate N-acetyltransferase GlmU [Chloroflexota bacterium]|nr:bifunctional UDP-N-acetylglucosamine diphosphorylase/glucosamine-1-phosphate N-acetyltransferase GlmU [Chloroflexota bacterium]